MLQRRWHLPVLLVAFFLSLLLHLLGLFGEELHAWLTRPEFAETEVKQTSRTLKEQVLQDEEALLELAHVRQPGELVVYRSVPQQGGVPEKRSPSSHRSRHVEVSVPPPEVASTVLAVSRSAKPDIPVASQAAVASQPAVAKSPTVAVGQLERFPRDLSITYVWGILQAHMNWKVVNGRYDLSMKTGLPGLARTYTSSGRVGRQGVVPERFVEYHNNKPEPYYQVDFDWQKKVAQLGKPGERKEEAISAGDQDIFSAAFHVGLVGNRQEQSFAMFTGRKKYEAARLVLAGEARLRFGDKDVDVLLMRGQWRDRRVDFWLAPEWHNIPVRMTIALGKDMSFDIWANEITMDGRTVLAWVAPDSTP